MPRVAIYPGCSLEGSSSSFDISCGEALRALGIEREVLKDWNCCGASSAHAVDHKLYLSLNLRNLAPGPRPGLRGGAGPLRGLLQPACGREPHAPGRPRAAGFAERRNRAGVPRRGQGAQRARLPRQRSRHRADCRNGSRAGSKVSRPSAITAASIRAYRACSPSTRWNTR